MRLTLALVAAMAIGFVGILYDYFVRETTPTWNASAVVFLGGVLIIETRLREIRDRLPRAKEPEC